MNRYIDITKACPGVVLYTVLGCVCLCVCVGGGMIVTCPSLQARHFFSTPKLSAVSLFSMALLSHS